MASRVRIDDDDDNHTANLRHMEKGSCLLGLAPVHFFEFPREPGFQSTVAYTPNKDCRQTNLVRSYFE